MCLQFSEKWHHLHTNLRAYRNAYTKVIFTRKRTHGRCNSCAQETHTHAGELSISMTVLSTLHLLFGGFVGPAERSEVFAQRDGVGGVGGIHFYTPVKLHSFPLTAATWWGLLMACSTVQPATHTHKHTHAHILHQIFIERSLSCRSSTFPQVLNVTEGFR